VVNPTLSAKATLDPSGERLNAQRGSWPKIFRPQSIANVYFTYGLQSSAEGIPPTRSIRIMPGPACS